MIISLTSPTVVMAKESVQTRRLSLSTHSRRLQKFHVNRSAEPSANPPTAEAIVSIKMPWRIKSFPGVLEVIKSKGSIQYGVPAPSLILDSHCIVRCRHDKWTYQDEIAYVWRHMSLNQQGLVNSTHLCENTLDDRRGQDGVSRANVQQTLESEKPTRGKQT